MNADCSFFIQG